MKKQDYIEAISDVQSKGFYNDLDGFNVKDVALSGSEFRILEIAVFSSKYGDLYKALIEFKGGKRAVMRSTSGKINRQLQSLADKGLLPSEVYFKVVPVNLPKGLTFKLEVI